MTDLYNMWFKCLFKQLPAEWRSHTARMVVVGNIIQLDYMRLRLFKKPIVLYSMVRKKHTQGAAIKGSMKSQTSNWTTSYPISCGEQDISKDGGSMNILYAAFFRLPQRKKEANDRTARDYCAKLQKAGSDPHSAMKFIGWSWTGSISVFFWG